MATAATAPAVFHRPYRNRTVPPPCLAPQRGIQERAKAAMPLNAFNFLERMTTGKARCLAVPSLRAYASFGFRLHATMIR